MVQPSTANSSLTPEKMESLRTMVRDRLEQMGVGEHIKDIISQHAGASKELEPHKLLEEVKAKGLIDVVVHSLSASHLHAADVGRQVAPQRPVVPADPGERRFMRITMKGGKGFMEYLAREALPDEKLEVSGELFGQRFRFEAVDAAVEPAFTGVAVVQLPGDCNLVPLQLLPYRQQLQLVCVQRTTPAATPLALLRPSGGQDGADGRAAVLGTARVEWRRALAAGGNTGVTALAELALGPGAAMGGGVHAHAPAGVVELQLQVVPPLLQPLDLPLLRSQIRAEAAADKDAVAALLAAAKAWWADYVRGHPSLRTRCVKLMALGEDSLQRPCCSWVQPLQLGRRLPSPQHAARFVSLLVPPDAAGLTGAVVAGAGERWWSLHSMMASASAPSEGRAVLLCGLLLGFGLDAWAVIGRNSAGASHTWVLTRCGAGTATFWEPSTGLRYQSDDALSEGFPFASVACVFNHERLCANLQEHDAVAGLSYSFEDTALWKPLLVDPASVPGPPWVPVDLSGGMDVEQQLEAELQLEEHLKTALSNHRWQAHTIQHTRWDDGLGFLLMPALLAYEQEAITGETAAGNEEFQQSIKRAVPSGWVFQGFPKHFPHMSAPAMVRELLGQPTICDMLAVDTPDGVYALRVKVFAYPEGVCSLWLMLAMKYRAAPPPPT